MYGYCCSGPVGADGTCDACGKRPSPIPRDGGLHGGPLARANVDRRTAPRRKEDAALHYAREALIAAALEWHDNLKDFQSDPSFDAAVEAYRLAEKKAAR